jgi:RNA polymerase sigma factor (sigma-70 family)
LWGSLGYTTIFYFTEQISLEDNLVDIIRGCQRGDSRCQKMLYTHFFGYGISVVRRFSSVEEDAREILNDAFVKVFSKIHLFDELSDFKPWFRKIVVNASIDHCRSLVAKDPTIKGEELTHLIPESVNFLDSLNARDIIHLLDSLPNIYRIPFVLFEIEGYSHAEIAKRLNIKESTSRGNLTRAKQQLQVLVAKHYSYEKQ